MRRLVVGVLGAGLIAAAAPAGEEAFRAEVLGELRKAHPGERFGLGAEPLVIVLRPGSGEEGGVLNLHNLYEHCRNAPAAECAASRAEWARKVLIAPPAVTRASLRLLVRRQDYVDYLAAQKSKDGAGAMFTGRRIGEDLHLLLAADGPDTITMVGTRQLAALGMTEAEAWAAAEANMAAITGALPTRDKLQAGVVGFGALPYGSAILGRLAHWSEVADEGGPALFATAVSDDFIVIGFLRETDVGKLARSARDNCKAAPRCISPHVYRLRDGQWRIVG